MRRQEAQGPVRKGLVRGGFVLILWAGDRHSGGLEPWVRDRHCGGQEPWVRESLSRRAARYASPRGESR